MGPAASHFTGGCWEVVDIRCSQVSHIYFTLLHHSASFCIILHHSASFCIILHHSASLSFSHMHPETLSCHVQGIPDTEWWKDPAALVPAPLLETATPGPCFGPLRSIAMGTVHTLSPVAIASFASFSSFDSGSFGSLMKDCTTEMFETRYCESMWIYCCYWYLLRVTVIDSIGCLGPRGRNSFVKHMKASCDKRNKRCCTKYILKY